MPDNGSVLWQSCGRENEVAIELPHIRLAGRIWGDDDKPLLIALHGWLDNANSFVPLAQHLSEYQLLAVDWPGHGFSQHRPGAYPLHWLDYLYDLDALIAKITAVKPIYAVVGHSLGAIVASAYSAAFATKVPHWIFIEALSPLFEDPNRSRSRLVRSFRDHHTLAVAKERSSRTITLDAAVKARHRLTGLDTQWCRLLIERNLEITQFGVRWRSDPRLKLDSPMRLTFEHVQGLMQGHNAEVLLISGREGYPITPEVSQRIRSWYHKLTQVELEGDHHLHMGNSERVAAEIKGFLAVSVNNHRADKLI
jgi:pimeloyl-ACP methyl ester carboxylesterase